MKSFLLLSLISLGFCALVTNPNDPRVWQGATIGTFARVIYGQDTQANRERLIAEQKLDDGILTASLTSTGTLQPTSWAQNYGGCRGQSFDNYYDYTCSASRNIYELANSIDAFWFQSSNRLGDTLFDLGATSYQAAVFVAVDHGPMPAESIESTIYLSDTKTGPWTAADVYRVYLQGYLPDNVPSVGKGLYDGFTYVVRPQVADTFRYISLIHGGEKSLQKDGDDEINGVVGLDLNFNNTRVPLTTCIRILLLYSNIETVVSPILLSGFYTSTAASNYGYSIFDRRAGVRTFPAPLTDAVQIFFSQDFENSFSLNVLIDSNDGTAGNLTLRITSTNLGASTAILVFDDPASPANAADPADSYQWFPSTGQGQFTWNWGTTTTDGLVLGPLNIIDATQAFTIEFEIINPVGIPTNRIFYVNQGAGATVNRVATGTRFTLKRESCSCGNAITELFEECDGPNATAPTLACCTSQCRLIAAGTPCRASAGDCDVAEFCNGLSGACPADTFQEGRICRASAGACDPQEVCGRAANCPEDARAPNTQECRAAVRTCDVAEFCNGGVSCPPDGFSPNLTTCDDGSPCSSQSWCEAGRCEPQDSLLCGGQNCGNGVLNSASPDFEQCDGGSPDTDADCCTSSCRFEPNTHLCRASSGARCDPPEFCLGNQGGCPADLTNSCPVCPDDCNNATGQGVCNPPGPIWRPGDAGVCQCAHGWVGPDCSIPDCSVFSDCGTCGGHPRCGWCCSGQTSGVCLEGNSTAPVSQACNSWQFDADCGCTPACVGGTCTCGKCTCDLGRTGPGCALYIGCDGLGYPTLAEAPEKDICGVCGGNGTSCLGCDGVAFSGKFLDQCNVCGGNGSSCIVYCSFRSCGDCISHGVEGQCHWCNSDSTCHETIKPYVCPKNRWIEEASNCENPRFQLSVAEAAGIGAGVVAAIVIASIVGVLIIGYGGKKGYDYWRASANRNVTIQDNPLYVEKSMGGDNPLYEETSGIKGINQ